MYRLWWLVCWWRAKIVAPTLNKWRFKKVPNIVKTPQGSVDRDIMPRARSPTCHPRHPRRTIIYFLCNPVRTMRELKYGSTFITCTHTHSPAKRPRHTVWKYIVRMYVRWYTHPNTIAQKSQESANFSRSFNRRNLF